MFALLIVFSDTKVKFLYLIYHQKRNKCLEDGYKNDCFEHEL